MKWWIGVLAVICICLLGVSTYLGVQLYEEKRPLVEKARFGDTRFDREEAIEQGKHMFEEPYAFEIDEEMALQIGEMALKKHFFGITYEGKTKLKNDEEYFTEKDYENSGKLVLLESYDGSCYMVCRFPKAFEGGIGVLIDKKTGKILAFNDRRK